MTAIKAGQKVTYDGQTWTVLRVYEHKPPMPRRAMIRRSSLIAESILTAPVSELVAVTE